MGDLSHEQAVTAWSAHLREGGTTPWQDFSDPRPSAPAAGAPLPDSVHLELVRRLNLVTGGTAHPGLADRVLATVAPGRGRVDIPLPQPGAGPAFGSAPIDPADLPPRELVRLAVGVLAQLLPGVPPTPPAPAGPAPRWPLPWRQRFRLHGSPATTAAVRRSLLAQGLVESDWRPTHLVIARPIEVMMAEHWADRVHAGSLIRWSGLWRRARTTGRLPGRIDVAALAGRLHAADPRSPVHVVLAREAEDAVTLAANLLGTRPGRPPEATDLCASELLRRVNRLTALTCGPDRVRALSATLERVLATSHLSSETPAPVVPRDSQAWAGDTAVATRDAITGAGYPVLGDPDALLPAGRPGRRDIDQRTHQTIDLDRTLELALSASLRAWQLQEDRT